jgi:hypothetical protein
MEESAGLPPTVTIGFKAPARIARTELITMIVLSSAVVQLNKLSADGLDCTPSG